MADPIRTTFGRGADGAVSSLIDPSTYGGDSGSGFVVEQNNNLGVRPLVPWDTVYGINDQSENSGGEAAHDDAAFSWDPDPTGTFGVDTPCYVTVKQSGLYTIELTVNFDTLETYGDIYTFAVGGTSTGDFLFKTDFPLAQLSPQVSYVRWLAAGTVNFQTNNVNVGLSEVGFAQMRLAPMFTLTGIEES